MRHALALVLALACSQASASQLFVTPWGGAYGFHFRPLSGNPADFVWQIGETATITVPEITPTFLWNHSGTFVLGPPHEFEITAANALDYGLDWSALTAELRRTDSWPTMTQTVEGVVRQHGPYPDWLPGTFTPERVRIWNVTYSITLEGTYMDVWSSIHGFTRWDSNLLPEPSSLWLLSIATILMPRRTR